MNGADPLSALRAVRLPEAVSWWPLAPGWWLLVALVVLGLGVACVLMLRRRRSLMVAALREVHALRRRTAGGADGNDIATAVGALLRRTALADKHSVGFAALHGDAWSARLSSGNGALPAPLAEWVAAAPYALPVAANDALHVIADGDRVESGSQPDTAALLDAAEHWIRRNAR